MDNILNAEKQENIKKLDFKYRSAIGQLDNMMELAQLNLTDEEFYDFCDHLGSIGAYIRLLIKRNKEKLNDKV